MGEERKTFVGLGWENEIRSLGDPDVPFIPSPERDIRAGNQCSDDYDLTPFSQSTQARRWRMQEEQKQNTKKVRWHFDVLEKDAGVNEVAVVNEENTTNMDDEVTEVGESSKSMSFRQRMRGSEPHHLPLKDRLKDKTVPYMDLFRPGPPPSRRDDDTYRRIAKRK